MPQGDLTALKAEAESIASEADYAIGGRTLSVETLHTDPAKLAEGNRNVAELAYGNILQNSASTDNWFDLLVLIIPCIYVCGPFRLTYHIVSTLEDLGQTRSQT